MTPGGAPWKNSVAERYGGTIKNMVYKVLGESKAALHQIVRQCVLAKNDSHVHHGYSPAEWAVGRRARRAVDPLAQEELLPSFSLVDSEEAFSEKLDLQMKARVAFESQRSREVISRALRQRPATPEASGSLKSVPLLPTSASRPGRRRATAEKPRTLTRGFWE